MASQHPAPLSASIKSQGAPATTTPQTSIASFGTQNYVSFPPSGDSLDEVESVPILSDDEDDVDRVARGHVRGRRDSAASVKTVRGCGEQRQSVSRQRKEERPSKRAAPSPRRARPFKRCRAQVFSIGGASVEEVDWSEQMDGCKFSPCVTSEGFIQLNPASLSNARNHASTSELAELIALVADEAEAAKALDHSSAAVLAGTPVETLFEVSIKFAKRHMAVWDVDFRYVSGLVLMLQL